MRIDKILIFLSILLLLGNGLATAADYHKGLAAYDSGDYKTAIAEWTPLAEQGNARAQNILGLIYQNGKGVAENDKTAVNWYTLAAKQGDAYAQVNLGFMHQHGKGVSQNHNTAVNWYTLSAEQGNARAQNNLGFMYVTGSGVLTDHLRAYMWWNLASYNGHEWWNLASYNGHEVAGENKDQLAIKMTPADITIAQAMSSRCFESGYTDC